MGEDGEVVLGVDTVVVLSGRVLGKPADQAEACEMLTALQGREHVVCSGLTVVTAEGPSTASAETRVRFRALGPAEIAAYVALGEWRGRAGGYAIQERGALLIESIEGDYLNVVGLPVALLVRMLESTRLGLHFAQIGNSDRLL